MNRSRWLLPTTLAAIDLTLALAGGHRRLGEPDEPPVCWPERPVLAFYALAAAAMVALQAHAWGQAPIGWDGLVYHLDWAAQFRARGDLAVNVVPSGDPAIPFYPRAGSLWTLWYLLPSTRLDSLAPHLELPFALGCVLLGALWCASRLARTGRAGAVLLGLALGPLALDRGGSRRPSGRRSPPPRRTGSCS